MSERIIIITIMVAGAAMLAVAAWALCEGLT